MQQYLEAGKIVNLHGVRGDMRIECYCDSPKILSEIKTLYLRAPDGSYTPHKCARMQVYKGMVLARFEGVDTYEAAAVFKNQTVFADRTDIPCKTGTYFIADLLGLPVIDAENGTVYGKMSDVVNYGAGNLYEVTSDEGKVFLVPAIPQFIARVELEKGVFVTPIGGLFS